MSWLDGITVSMDEGLNQVWETVRDRGAGVLQSLVSDATQRLNNS